jgi:hypothetical protein
LNEVRDNLMEFGANEGDNPGNDELIRICEGFGISLGQFSLENRKL